MIICSIKQVSTSQAKSHSIFRLLDTFYETESTTFLVSWFLLHQIGVFSPKSILLQLGLKKNHINNEICALLSMVDRGCSFLELHLQA